MTGRRTSPLCPPARRRHRGDDVRLRSARHAENRLRFRARRRGDGCGSPFAGRLLHPWCAPAPRGRGGLEEFRQTSRDGIFSPVSSKTIAATDSRRAAARLPRLPLCTRCPQNLPYNGSVSHQGGFVMSIPQSGTVSWSAWQRLHLPSNRNIPSQPTSLIRIDLSRIGRPCPQA